MVEDEILKIRFKCGSRDALARIYEKYMDYLLTLAVALLNDINAAEDVLHDVFLSFAGSAEKFKLRGSLKGYLGKCVINRTRDLVRKNQRQAGSVDNAAVMMIAVSSGPDEKVICSEESRRVNAMIGQLPYEQREAVVLHIKGGMKFREIARLQGVNINTVQGRYRYGIDKVRTLLNGEAPK